MNNLAFDYIAGTGGIGKGVLFKLAGEHILGKNESRLAELTDFKDYCKLHIILHYAAVYLQGQIPVYAIGCVGDDAAGHELTDVMGRAGINVGHVRRDADSKTLYAVCFQYPDGEGGNITTSNSACNTVDESDIDRFFAQQNPAGKGLLLAAPEVPVCARIRLLEHGRARGCCNVASVLSGEIAEFDARGGFRLVDILAVNEDEASAIALAAPTDDLSATAEERCLAYLAERNGNMTVIVTQGKAGAYTYRNGEKSYSPTIDNTVVNTAGAGDCFLGTLIAALAHGVPLDKTESGPVVSSAPDLAGISSSLKVSCSDTIHFEMSKQALWNFAAEKKAVFSPRITSDFFGREGMQMAANEKRYPSAR